MNLLEKYFSEKEFKSKRLKRLTTIGDLFPDLTDEIEYFKTAFDREKAKSEGKKNVSIWGRKNLDNSIFTPHKIRTNSP